MSKDDWIYTTDVDEWRAKHKHHEVVGGFKDNVDKKLRYCKPCDMFYYPQE